MPTGFSGNPAGKRSQHMSASGWINLTLDPAPVGPVADAPTEHDDDVSEPLPQGQRIEGDRSHRSVPLLKACLDKSVIHRLRHTPVTLELDMVVDPMSDKAARWEPAYGLAPQANVEVVGPGLFLTGYTGPESELFADLGNLNHKPRSIVRTHEFVTQGTYERTHRFHPLSKGGQTVLTAWTCCFPCLTPLRISGQNQAAQTVRVPILLSTFHAVFFSDSFLKGLELHGFCNRGQDKNDSGTAPRAGRSWR